RGEWVAPIPRFEGHPELSHESLVTFTAEGPDDVVVRHFAASIRVLRTSEMTSHADDQSDFVRVAAEDAIGERPSRRHGGMQRSEFETGCTQDRGDPLDSGHQELEFGIGHPKTPILSSSSRVAFEVFDVDEVGLADAQIVRRLEARSPFEVGEDALEARREFRRLADERSAAR